MSNRQVAGKTKVQRMGNWQNVLWTFEERFCTGHVTDKTGINSPMNRKSGTHRQSHVCWANSEMLSKGKSKNAGNGKGRARRKSARSPSPPSASCDTGEEQNAQEQEVPETRHDSQEETLFQSGKIPEGSKCPSHSSVSSHSTQKSSESKKKPTKSCRLSDWAGRRPSPGMGGRASLSMEFEKQGLQKQGYEGPPLWWHS